MKRSRHFKMSNGAAVADESKAQLKKPRKKATFADEVNFENELAQVRESEQLIFESKQNVNHIVKLLNFVTDASEGSLVLRLGATQSLRRVFARLATDKELVFIKPKETDDSEAVVQYKDWLRSLYKKYVAQLLVMLQGEDAGLQLAGMHYLMDFVKMESRADASSTISPLFASVVVHILVNPHSTTHTLLEAWRDGFVAAYDDLRTVALKQISNLLDEEFSALCSRANVAPSETYTAHDFARTMLQFLLPLRPEESGKIFIRRKTDDSESSSRFDTSSQQRFLSRAWLALLKRQLPVDVYKTVLVHLHKDILPLISTPLVLADFLTDSYNIGGVVSLLALNGLFVLISKYNLDYPDFFGKLYRLLQPSIFYAKYRARFFRLLALFLTSSYLPSYLVAAFVKRLSRLALTAPPGGAMFICALIFNLMQRHPAVRVLINKPPTAAGQSKVALLLLKPDNAPTSADVLKLDVPASSAAAAASAASSASVPSSSASADFGAPSEGRDEEGLSDYEMDEGDDDEDEGKEKEKEKTSKKEDSSDDDEDAEAETQSKDGEGEGEGEGQKKKLSLEEIIARSKVATSQRSELKIHDGSDPYDAEASDPLQSNAAHSSLWELKTLCNHYCPPVASMAKLFFADNAPKQEFSIEQYINHSHKSMFEKEMEWRKNQQMPLSFEKHSSLFTASDSFADMFEFPTATTVTAATSSSSTSDSTSAAAVPVVMDTTPAPKAKAPLPPRKKVNIEIVFGTADKSAESKEQEKQDSKEKKTAKKDDKEDKKSKKEKGAKQDEASSTTKAKKSSKGKK